MEGPKLLLAQEIHRQKYRLSGETFREAGSRFAQALSDDPEHFYRLRDIYLRQLFLPAGRIQSAAGSPQRITALNCFVSGPIHDSMGGIMDKAKEAAQTMRLGGGIGYDFCLAPGTMITTPSGCTPVEDLKCGEEVVGFPEEFNLQRSLFEPSFVEDNKKVIQPCYKITTNKGTVISSSDHLFVARTKRIPKKSGEGMRWIKARDLEVGNFIAFTTNPWNKNDVSDSWIAGMFDGEGWSSDTHVGIAQNKGDVANRIWNELTELGIKFRIHERDKLLSFIPNGKWEAIKLFSQIKPTRLSWSIYGRKMCGKSSLPAEITSIKYLGEIETYATRTSTRTLIANGFLSHNSTIRPRDSLITTLGSRSSGPVSFMEIFNSVCATVSSAGNRRGAQMGVLRVDHPDIEEFIEAKCNTDRLTNFNISVGITDEFMEAVESNSMFRLRFKGQTHKQVSARMLFDKIMRATWNWAEPGVLFLDRINEINNLYYCEKISSSNPCGEQPLPPYGACLLGSYNMTKMVDSGTLDLGYIKRTIDDVVRAMDNVIDETTYPLKQQEEEAKNKRRIGLGLTGLANSIEILGCPYGSEDFLDVAEKAMKELVYGAYRASIQLAKEKGSFPLFNRDSYLGSKFIHSLPEDIQQGIFDHGIRNSHLISFAPCGTISLAADNVSSGIEPVFSYEYTRDVLVDGRPVTETITDYGYRVFGIKGKCADDCSVDDHLSVLALASRYSDSAVSKTINVGPDVSWEDFKDIYLKAWRLGCKGVTTFRSAGKRYGILNSLDGGACYIDPTTGDKSCG